MHKAMSKLHTLYMPNFKSQSLKIAEIYVIMFTLLLYRTTLAGVTKYFELG
jgi:hypothetical protein